MSEKNIYDVSKKNTPDINITDKPAKYLDMNKSSLVIGKEYKKSVSFLWNINLNILYDSIIDIIIAAGEIKFENKV